MLQATLSKHGLKKGQWYSLKTDGDYACFVSRGKRKLIKIPICNLSSLQLKASNDENGYAM